MFLNENATVKSELSLEVLTTFFCDNKVEQNFLFKSIYNTVFAYNFFAFYLSKLLRINQGNVNNIDWNKNETVKIREKQFKGNQSISNQPTL